MMEEERLDIAFPLRDAVITVVIAALMGLSSFFSLFLALPLLTFSYKHSRRNTFIVLGIILALLTAHSFYEMKGSDYYLFMVLMNLYIPISLSAGGTIWASTKERSVDLRLILCLIPALLIVAVCAAILCADRALFSAVYNGYKDAFVPVLEELITSLDVSIDVELFFLVIMTFASAVMLPLVVGAVCVSLFMFELVVHSREGDWDEKLCSIEFSQGLVWVLIFFLALSLISRLVSVPAVVFILSMSVTMSLFIIYGVQGFSVLYSWVKNREWRMKSNTLFFILLTIGLFVPGLNIIVLLGVPILGILENFFDLKKRKKDENYS